MVATTDHDDTHGWLIMCYTNNGSPFIGTEHSGLELTGSLERKARAAVKARFHGYPNFVIRSDKDSLIHL